MGINNKPNPIFVTENKIHLKFLSSVYLKRERVIWDIFLQGSKCKVMNVLLSLAKKWILFFSRQYQLFFLFNFWRRYKINILCMEERRGFFPSLSAIHQNCLAVSKLYKKKYFLMNYCHIFYAQENNKNRYTVPFLNTHIIQVYTSSW